MIVRVEVALLHPRVKERGCCLESPACLRFFVGFVFADESRYLLQPHGVEIRNKPRSHPRSQIENPEEARSTEIAPGGGRSTSDRKSAER